MNLKDIADAIATRFVGTTATIGTETQGIEIGPTASLPNTLGKGTALLVFHPIGTLELGFSQMRDDHYDFPVRLLLDPLDYPRRSDWLYAWATALRDQVATKLQLGLPYVAWAEPVAMRVELDVEHFYSAQYDMVELTVRVRVYEHVSSVQA